MDGADWWDLGQEDKKYIFAAKLSLKSEYCEKKIEVLLIMYWWPTDHCHITENTFCKYIFSLYRFFFSITVQNCYL